MSKLEPLVPKTFSDNFLKSLAVDGNVLVTIQNHVIEGKDPKSALIAAQREAKASRPTAGPRLQLAVDLLELCPDDLHACEQMLSDTSIKTISDVALHYYCAEPIKQSLFKDLKSVRSCLLYREATAVLLALVSNGKLDLNKDLKGAIEAFLQIAVAAKFDVRKASLTTLLSDTKYQKTLNSTNLLPARVFLESAQRLLAVITDGEDLRYLLGTRYVSASAIANAQYNELVDVLSDRGFALGEIANVFNEATRINRRNEQLWTDLIRSRQKVPMRAVQSMRDSTMMQTTRSGPINLTTLFNEMDGVDCDESSSVLGPAAYLVDLLQLLKDAPLPSRSGSPFPEQTLLDVLFSRRPDIGHIELSKRNTKTPLPYIDLTIDIMEQHASTDDKTTLYDDTAQDEDSPSYEALNSDEHPINWKFYQAELCRQIVPMSVFPFNLAINYCRRLFEVNNLSRHQLLRAFQSKHELVARCFDPSMKQQACALAETAVNRRLASEYLGLQPADYTIITGEAYQTRDFLRLSNFGSPDGSDYGRQAGAVSAAESWGYETDKASTALWKMCSPESPRRLTKIKDEMLPRSGLSFSELLLVLKTSFMGNRLVITAGDDDNFSERLSDFRLQDSMVVTFGETKGALSEKTCQDLQAFIRLSRKLGWSVKDTDAAIVALARRDRLSKDIPIFSYTLDGYLIEKLAAAKQLADSTGFSITDLLPLWSPMSESLYTRLFLRSGWLSRFPKLSIQNGSALDDATIADNLEPTLRALRTSESDLQSLISALDLNMQTPWTLEVISQLYNANLLCRILEIGASQYGSWLIHCLPLTNPFYDPHSTLAILEPWRSLAADIGSAKELMEILDTTMAAPEINIPSFTMTQQILRCLAEIESKYSSLLAVDDAQKDSSLFTREELVSIISMMFGADIANDAISFIEGTSHVDSSVVLDSKTTIPDHLVGKLVRQTPNRIRFYGVLLDQEKTDALSLDPKNPAWQSAVLSSDENQRSIFRFLEHNFPEGTFDLKKFAASTALLPLDEQETVQCQRRKSAIQELIPTIKLLKADQLVRSILSTAFPRQSTQILRALLEQLNVDTVGNSGSFDGFTYLLNLFKESNAGSKTNETSFKAFFFPPVSSDYTFRSAANHAGLVVDNQSLITPVPEPKGDVDKPTTSATASAAITPSFKEGQSYALELTGSSIDELTYATTQAKVRPMTSDIFCPAAVFSNVCFLVSGLQRSAQILDSLKLDLSEITYFAHHGSKLASLRLSSLLNLHSYSKCRDKFLAKGRSALLKFLQWITSMSASSKSHDALVTQLCDQLEAITTFSKAEISAYVNFKCSGMAPLETIRFFENTDDLSNLAECMQYAARTAAPLVSLMEWAKFPSAPTWTEDFEFVSSLTAAAATSPKVHAMSAARDSVRLKRQEVLKSFLLTQRHFRDLEITSSDGLFEYFLIDVQMGPDLKSSRIQQAIASVQLFVQRCLLGLEKKNGVPTTLIDQTKWAWKSKFTHWQANRKVFLYPENWVDPTFRDDKTEAFQTFESKVLQSNLSLETINGLIREYIYAANEVADLEVQSYLWEATRGFRGRYHFFARTRTGPSVFYYRKLEVMGANAANAQWNWYPWAKMDVEIPTHEIDADGSTLAKPATYLLPALFKGRLFLFIPRIMKKTSSPPKANGTFRDLAKKHVATRDPQEYWEIKMAWTELRNGKWSAQQTTSTGIEYKLPTPEKKQIEKTALPSISSFRFSLQTRFAPSSFWASGVNNASSSNTSESGSAGSAPPKILVISVERWHGQNDKEGELFLIGKFEMQGPRLRVVPNDTAVNTMTTKGFRTKFSRLEHDSSSTELKGLIEETAVYKIWDDNDQSRPLLAVVSPDDDTSRESPYNLTWLLAFDDSQYKGASGLILERSTRSKIETFFGFPNVSRDGNIDELNKTTAITQSMTHDVSRLLMENITLSEDLSDIFATLEGVPKYMIYSALGQEGDKFHELASPYAIYNWELGFHIVCLLMERLLAAQQFELALQLSRQVFDPTRDDANHKDAAPGSVDTTQVRAPMSRLDQCWRFHPFKSPEVRTAGSVRDIIQRLEPGSSTSSEIAEWAANPFSAHSAARGRPAVYMKRFVMKCIEILIASGDQYFRNNSLEAMPYAIQRYTEAAELFGPPPQSINPPTKPVTHTYVQIKNLVNDFASAAVDMELQFPFFTNTADRIAPPNALGEKASTLGFVRSTYFGVPANPQLKAMRALIDDRFYKIRHGLDINGNPLSLPLFDPPLDVEQLVAGAASGSFSRTIIAGVEGPMPNYRSLYILEKAMEICNELRSFLDSFLAIKEKRDVESLACLRAKQDSTIQNLMVDIKEMQKAEAVNSLEVLEETRNSHKMRLKYYLDLLGEPSSKVPNAKSEWDDIEQAIERPQDDELKITSQEKWEMDLNLAAGALSTVAASLEAGGGTLMALPELLTMLAPMGMGTQIKFDASNIGKGILVAAGVMKGGAQALNEDASRIAKKGQYISRIQERRLQANMAGHDLKSTDKQIVAQRKRIAVAEAEIKLQKQQTQNMTEVEDYLRTKYTSESLYAWLEASVRQSCYQSYLMTMEMAKAAERAFAFEHGPKAQQFLSNAYWNEARDGLLAAQDISMALRRMEAAYMKAKAHDYEITKNISLRQITPLALFSLRDKGTASFVLPEVIFDYDFPGHYCRRIKSVAISIPCIIGPYTSASCSLRLLEHRYRLKAGASSTGGYYEEDVDGDERFRTDNVPVTAVAISSAHQDTGVFDLNFKDERYIPFEGAGTISRWQLDLPAPFRQFDYNTISDVVISFKYTALEGGAVWRKTATEAVIEHRKRVQERQEDGGAFLTLKVPNDFPEEWSRFLDTSSRTAGISAASLKLKQLSDRLPFWTTGQRVCTGKLWLILTPEKDESKELQNTIKHDSVTLLGAKMVPSSENYEKFILLESNDEKDLRKPLQDGELVFSADIVRRKIQNCWIVVQYSLS